MSSFTNFEYMQSKNETQEQQVVFDWAALQFSKWPALEFMYHVPNEGKRSAVGGAVLKRIGLKRGVPDIVLPAPNKKYHGLYIEMKCGKNKPTEDQKRYMRFLSLAGYKVALCYSAEAAIDVIKKYLLGEENDE